MYNANDRTTSLIAAAVLIGLRSNIQGLVHRLYFSSAPPSRCVAAHKAPVKMKTLEQHIRVTSQRQGNGLVIRLSGDWKMDEGLSDFAAVLSQAEEDGAVFSVGRLEASANPSLPLRPGARWK